MYEVLNVCVWVCVCVCVCVCEMSVLNISLQTVCCALVVVFSHVRYKTFLDSLGVVNRY